MIKLSNLNFCAVCIYNLTHSKWEPTFRKKNFLQKPKSKHHSFSVSKLFYLTVHVRVPQRASLRFLNILHLCFIANLFLCTPESGEEMILPGKISAPPKSTLHWIKRNEEKRPEVQRAVEEETGRQLKAERSSPYFSLRCMFSRPLDIFGFSGLFLGSSSGSIINVSFLLLFSEYWLVVVIVVVLNEDFWLAERWWWCKWCNKPGEKGEQWVLLTKYCWILRFLRLGSVFFSGQEIYVYRFEGSKALLLV